MPKLRLDQILNRLGLVNGKQLERALDRQRERGGRIGTHLIETGALTPSQLLHALSEQHGVPSIMPHEEDVDVELLARLPEGFAMEFMALPLARNPQRPTPAVAIADPGDEAVLAQIASILGLPAVEPLVAPESILLDLAARLSPRARRLIELPELFELSDPAELPFASGEIEPEVELRPVLLVSSGATSRNYLPPIFAREGWRLVVATTSEELGEALRAERFEHVLVAQRMAESFTGWMRKLDGVTVGPNISVFPSVTRALMDNPAPYERTARSVKRAVELFAQQRCEALGLQPRHRELSRDVEALARRCGLRELAADGLSVAAHLLLPQAPLPDIQQPIEDARHIGFPWSVERALQAVDRLLSEPQNDAGVDAALSEVEVGAQALALVWYRHVVLGAYEPVTEEAVAELKRRLRQQAGRLARLELIESYLRMMDERGAHRAESHGGQILVLGNSAAIMRPLVERLGRVGYRTIVASELADAQGLIARRHPAAILLDHESFPEEAENLCRLQALNPSTPVYVVTGTSDPVTTLALLDAGAEDVYAPPHDFDLMVARLDRSLRARAERADSMAPAKGQLAATLEAFSLIDLLQILGHGLRSVRIDLTRSNGESACTHLREGQLVHAVAGAHSGEQAIYEVIAWGEDGSFVVMPIDEFPADNIEQSMESVLMEACRILDENAV